MTDFCTIIAKIEDPNHLHSMVDILDNYDVRASCPCSHSDDYTLQHEDYVTNPMIWCDGCGRRSFICMNCVPEVVDGDKALLKCPLLVVRNIVNRQIYNWKWTDELYENYFEEFTSLGCFDEEDEFAKSIGLENSDEHEKLPEHYWKYAVDCDSTNTVDVSYLDMSHDGISIYCDCVCEKCGTESKTEYWGD